MVDRLRLAGAHNYFFIYTFFSQARAQVRPVGGFLHAIAQKT